MLFAFVFTLIAVAGGVLLTYLYDEDARLAARLCAGAVIGLSALGLIGFIFASLLSLTPSALFLTSLVGLMPLALLWQPVRRAAVRADITEAQRALRQVVFHPASGTALAVALYLLLAGLLYAVFERAMIEGADGHIYTGALNNFGDLPFHISVITGFAFGENYPPEDPTYAGARFTYPFLADFISAMFVRAGASLRASMLLPNMVCALALVGLLYRWGRELTGARAAALITVALVIFSGGLGWWLLWRDAGAAGVGVFELLWQLPADYTIRPRTNWRWGNAVTALFITQRSLLIGLPLALIVFTQWWAALRSSAEGKSKKAKGKSKDKTAGSAEHRAAASSLLSPFYFYLLPSARRMLAAGLVAGLLPLIHAHTFVVVMGMGGCLALLFWAEWRAWAAFFVAALALAVPQLLWVTWGSEVQAGTFFAWHFGWHREGGEENAIRFWFKNTGLFIPLLVAALLWRKRRAQEGAGKAAAQARAKRAGQAQGKSAQRVRAGADEADEERLVSSRLFFFFLPFALCFVIPNMVKLSPWEWDNIKILFYWYVAAAPLVALLLAHWLRSRLMTARILAVATLLSLTLAGALDNWRIAARASEYRIFDRAGVEFAEVIKRETPARALVLHAPIHNHPVFLTGRRSLMGYPGHIWTHGLEYAPREREVRAIYAGGTRAAALLARHGIEFVVVSPLERNLLPVNAEFFARYSLVGETGGYRLYKITP